MVTRTLKSISKFENGETGVYCTREHDNGLDKPKLKITKFLLSPAYYCSQQTLTNKRTNTQTQTHTHKHTHTLTQAFKTRVVNLIWCTFSFSTSFIKAASLLGSRCSKYLSSCLRVRSRFFKMSEGSAVAFVLSTPLSPWKNSSCGLKIKDPERNGNTILVSTL